MSALLLAMGLAMAAPSSGHEDQHGSPPTAMPSHLRQPLEPCPGEPGPWIDAIGQKGDQAAYLCAVRTEAVLQPLLAAIATAKPEDQALPRWTRALALHLAARSDREWDPAQVRLLNPADRRLLADAVKARRGRKSPSKEQDAIFQLQPWYNVDPAYTDGRLTPVERANIAMANKPPPPEPTAMPLPPLPKPPPPPAQGPPSTCGCANTGLAPAWGFAIVAILVGIQRRRR